MSLIARVTPSNGQRAVEYTLSKVSTYVKAAPGAKIIIINTTTGKVVPVKAAKIAGEDLVLDIDQHGQIHQLVIEKGATSEVSLADVSGTEGSAEVEATAPSLAEHSIRAHESLAGAGSAFAAPPVLLALLGAAAAGGAVAVAAGGSDKDKTPPATPNALDLATADDSGLSSTDNVTRNTSALTIAGKTEANATVELFDGATSLGTVNADASGNFNKDISLSGGTHSITAKATDAKGNVSAASAALSITVDTLAPSAPTGLDLATVDDTGISSTDNVTLNGSGLTITGTAEAGSTVELFDGATSIGSATANDSGAFTIDVSLAAGDHQLTAKATDVAGNVGVASSALNLTVNSAAPTLLNTSIEDSGVIARDVVTLYFSETLNESMIPTAAQFSVTNLGSKSITSVQVVGNKVLLTLDSSLDPAYTVAVRYSYDAANGGHKALQDLAGNKLSAAQDSQITNWLALDEVGAGFSEVPVATIALTLGAEISAYDPVSQRLFVTSSAGLQVIQVGQDLSLSSPITILAGVDINSVSVKNGVLAVAATNASDKTLPGTVYLLDARATTVSDVAMVVKQITVGALPDMVTFSPDGKTLLVANEAEQNDVDGGTPPALVNPEGSISIINLSAGMAGATVTTATFADFNSKLAALQAEGVRIFGDAETVAKDLEPEYIAISPDGKTAFVTLQENNAIGILDLTTGKFVDIVPLNLKSFNGLPFDGSDTDGLNLQANQPVYGMYMPDAIASYVGADGRTYYVIANEGDDRNDFIVTNEAVKASTLTLDSSLSGQTDLANLVVSRASGNTGDTDGDGDVDKLLSYGGRSFSILNDQGVMIFDSGTHIEQFAQATGIYDDGRADNKGMEPEGVTIGVVGDKTLAFVTLERGKGGVMIYDVTDPTHVEFVQYIGLVSDVAPEGVLFISAADSPTNSELLFVSNEASQTVSIYTRQIDFASNATVTAAEAFNTNSLVGVDGYAAFREIISAGEVTDNGALPGYNPYSIAGTMDGLGVLDNGDGTLTVLINHEFGSSSGAVRAHGSAGAFVTKMVVNKETLKVVSAEDFLQSDDNLYLASADGKSWTSGATTAFNRFCSGDLADFTAFKTDYAGYQGRIYLTGEEAGAEGRAFAHIVTGSEAGNVYELAAMGNLSFENLVANHAEQLKTIVVGLDDSTGGQVYIYVGDKKTTGNAVEQAGLTGGKLYGIKVTGGGMDETGTTANVTGLGLTDGVGAFQLAEIPNASSKTGAEIEAASDTAGVTQFLRPEDGAWSPDGKTFYFATTGSATTASRLWALNFADVSKPELGGTIKLLVDGLADGPVMLDNLTVSDDGATIILQEDPGNNDRLAKIWKYDLATDALTVIAEHNPDLFSGFDRITADEESSGVVDVTAFFQGVTGYDTTTYNYFMVDDQIHSPSGIPGVVEMGQFHLMVTRKDGAALSAAEQPFPAKQAYLEGVNDHSAFKAVINAGETAANGYVFDGTPDGLGVIDQGDGTLRVLVNHEFGATAGAVRAHGSTGAYVSDLVIDKATLQVISGQDFLQTAANLYLWNGTGWTSGATTQFARFCSGDLADDSAYHNSTTGYQGSIYLTGEEAGAEGRAFAHIVSGSDAGKVFELGSLGNMSFENLVGNHKEQAKTIVAALDDSTGGQVYIYVGDKQSTGNAVEQAGLFGGKLYGIKVTGGGMDETGAAANVTGLGLTDGVGTFALAEIAGAASKTGAEIETASDAASVTQFLRPEDGAWSANGETFYFVTTASSTTASRLWALDFTDISKPELGGKIKLLVDGLEGGDGPIMMDNLTVTDNGNILIQEDPGNNARLAAIWNYNPETDTLTKVAQHDPDLFTSGQSGFITQDEESSGIVDISAFLADVPGYDTDSFSYFLVADQVHSSFSGIGSVVEMGQLSIMATPVL